jgi:hypothetical protein
MASGVGRLPPSPSTFASQFNQLLILTFLRILGTRGTPRVVTKRKRSVTLPCPTQRPKTVL